MKTERKEEGRREGSKQREGGGREGEKQRKGRREG